jgi:hypothetical protein
MMERQVYELDRGTYYIWTSRYCVLSINRILKENRSAIKTMKGYAVCLAIL